uniref:Uncharacterized protein n=1 Tax=Phaeocystis antarctica TaxID=33657 RepID=A0A7S0DW18_9EUKA|mmetsp:Transcript_10005/g.23546  ORF Transcript_10005/g.23546 Transcript_10005/m.23546 type:complete len:496 (+) Transcript_10005:44-1531(+)
MMLRTLGLLLLAAEGALAQSREASQWDANVTAYGGTVDGCPCTADCSPNSLEEVVQVSSNSVTATFVSGADLKFAYLTDEHGTIISYKAGDDLDFGPTGSSSITFEWSASEQPTGVVPHIVYADSCADAVYRNPDGTTVTSTWRSKLALLAQTYDVSGGSSSYTSTIDAAPEITSITLDADWFNTGGSFAATFPAAMFSTEAPTGMNVAWLKNQDGTVLAYTEGEGTQPAAISISATNFPRGSVDLRACRLFPTEKLCTSESIVTKYINKIEGAGSAGLTPTDVGTYSTTNTAFTDAFTGHYDSGSGRTSIAPKSSDCKQYVMYAKHVDDDGVVIHDASGLLGFGFDKALDFAATSTMKYKVYLTCDGKALTTGIMDLAVFSSLNKGRFSVRTDEVQVGYPKCVGDRVADNTTWFEVDGRDCMCDKGTLFCKKAAPGSYFLMNEGESVGLALSVSLIVLLLLCGGIFLLLKKSAQSSEKMVVLKENAQASPEDRL